MSKELKTIKYLLEQCVNENIRKDLLDIETALEDYDSLLEKYDFKDIKELDDFLNKHRFIHQEQLNNEKKLKALEIIKEKDVDVVFVKRYKTVEEYNKAMDYIKYNGGDFTEHLTQEEYDSLKEVLL